MSKINIHVYTSSIQFESRIFKLTSTLIKKKIVDQIIIIGVYEKGLKEEEKFRESIIIKRLKSVDFIRVRMLNKFLKMLFFQVACYRQFKKSKPEIISCHTVWLLPVSILYKIFNRSTLIYETHELETERTGFSYLTKVIARTVEKIAIKFFIKNTVVVSESIKSFYKKRYKIDNIFVIRNCPEKINIVTKGKENLKDYYINKYQLDSDAIIFLYQGVFNYGRGLNHLIEAFSRVTRDNFHLVCMGFGPMQDFILEATKKSNNIHFHEAVSSDLVIDYASQAHVGVVVIEPISLSYLYCLPNKLFDYLNAGIPVLASNLPDMENVLQEHECGWTIEPNYKGIFEFIENIEISKIQNVSSKIQSNIGIFNWESETELLKKIY